MYIGRTWRERTVERAVICESVRREELEREDSFTFHFLAPHGVK